ncbi:hypothetical protein [Rhizobium sp. G21]|uniref:hypothetical protein n=1 Tax=Rhizobium sp. G21 TaxID=2758439 RepID=UPI0028A597F4|nr:hypothetical protein [Rhizobium sp. G21]
MTMRTRPGAFGESLLELQRFDRHGFGKVRRAFGVAGDGDVENAVLVEEAGFEHLHGGAEFAGLLVEAAADDQHVLDAGFADGALDALFERDLGGQAARGEMRHGGVAEGRDAAGGGDQRVGGVGADIGDVDAASGGKQARQVGGFDRLLRGDFDGSGNSGHE